MIRLLLAALFISSFSYAQVERDVVDINDQIRQLLLSRSYDQRTLLRVKNQLENVLLTLDGTEPNPNPGPIGGINQLKCLARDNDNAAPWILGAEKSDFSIVRYTQFVLGSLENCQAAINSARPMIGGMHTCVSRDNDGAAPYNIASIFADKAIKRTETFSLEQCRMTIQKARTTMDAFVLCVARDNDGAAPWIRLVVKRDGTSTRQTDTYPSVEACSQ